MVTRFDYRLHPFDRNVLSGMILWPIDQARDVLEFYGEWHEGLSNDLYVGPVMMTLPDGASVIAMEVLYAGDPVVGEKEMAPLRATGKPMDDGIKVQDYTVMQTQEDATFAHGIRSYIKNGMVRSITPELVSQLVESFRADPRLAFFTHTAGGAVQDVGELDTAFPHRNAQTMIMVGGGWTDPADDESAIAEARALVQRAGVIHGRLLRQHPLRRCRFDVTELWPELSAAADNQGAIRSGEPVPDEQQHRAGLTVRVTRRRRSPAVARLRRSIQLRRSTG